MLQRFVGLFRFLVDPGGMPLREGAAVGVLTGQADRLTFLSQCAEGQGLRRRPVDALAGGDHGLFGFELPGDLAVDGETLRNAGQRLANVLQRLQRNGRLAPSGVVAARLVEAGPGALEPVGAVGLVGLGRVEVPVQPLPHLPYDGLGLAFRHHALADQALRIEGAHGRVLLDAVVHQGLGEGRLVALVVAMPAVAEHVDHDVFFEGLPELRRDPGDVNDGFDIVPVHMKDRGLDDLGHVGAVRSRACVDRIGGEADLIVDDEMDRSADAVALELRQIERLRNQTLARKGGVAMQQQGHHLGAVAVAMLHLLGAHLADDDRIDRFQVRRIGGQRQVDGVAVELPVAGGAQMILDVPRAADVLRMGRAAAELVEDRLVGLAHEVGQHVEPAAVRHAEHHLLQAQLAATLQDLLQPGDHRLGPFQAEALGARVLLIEELLEGLGRRQTLQDRALARHREGRAVQGLVLDALLDPTLLIRILDVHELDADGSAVDDAADLDDFMQGRDFPAQDAVDEDRAVQVGL